jgi:hypothetical protein
MNPQKKMIFLVLISTSMTSTGHDLLSKLLIKSTDTSIGYAYDFDTSSDKIFSITKEEIAERIYEKSQQEDRKIFIKHFIKYSDNPNPHGYLGNNQTNTSTNMTAIMQQISSDTDYMTHADTDPSIITEGGVGWPPHHGEGELSRSSIEARELANEKCEAFYQDNLLSYGIYGELIPYFHENTAFSKIDDVDYYPYSAPKLDISHADKDFIISFTINFKCAFKP